MGFALSFYQKGNAKASVRGTTIVEFHVFFCVCLFCGLRYCGGKFGPLRYFGYSGKFGKEE